MGIQTGFLTGRGRNNSGGEGCVCVSVLESVVSSRWDGEVCGQGSESVVLPGWRGWRKSLKLGRCQVGSSLPSAPLPAELL